MVGAEQWRPCRGCQPARNSWKLGHMWRMHRRAEEIALCSVLLRKPTILNFCRKNLTQDASQALQHVLMTHTSYTTLASSCHDRFIFLREYRWQVEFDTPLSDTGNRTLRRNHGGH
jgi:hypothetical protein